MANPWDRGNFVLLSFPFTDLSSAKVRPALVIASLAEGVPDFIALMLTSKHHERVGRWEVFIDSTSDAFAATGLKVTSYVRCDKIYTFDRKMIRRLLGKASPAVLTQVESRLSDILGLKSRRQVP